MTDLAPIEPMTESDARLITGHMRNIIASVSEKLDDFVKMATAMYERRGWSALGYKSWDAYVSAELHTDRLSLERGERRELVAQLRSAGMSTRAIGSALGVHKDTVRGDLAGGENSPAVTGTDGKTYPSSPPVRDEPLLNGEGERRTVPAGSGTPRAQDELPDETPLERPVEGHPSPAPSAAVSEFLESDPDLQRERYMLAFVKALGRSDDFMEFDPDKLGDLADADVAQTLDDHLTRVQNFVDRFNRARRGLRVISGGRP